MSYMSKEKMLKSAQPVNLPSPLAGLVLAGAACSVSRQRVCSLSNEPARGEKRKRRFAPPAASRPQTSASGPPDARGSGHGRPTAAAVAPVSDGGRREAPVRRRDRPRPQVAPDVFREEDIALLTRWSSASTLRHHAGASAARTEARDALGKHTPSAEEDSGERHPNAFAVSEQLGLSCAGSGLGRAIQRILDFGRCDYLRHHLCAADAAGPRYGVSLIHYVHCDVTPQNALILASRARR